jgi:hypothetical protein
LRIVARDTPKGSVRRFFEDLVARPHTLAPDLLAREPRPLQLETFESEYVLKDAERTVVLYAIEGSGYADTLLMAWLPRERLLIEADVFTPTDLTLRRTIGFPFAANLLENIRRRNLSVDRIVPLHGDIGPLSALEQAAALPVPPTAR